MSKCLEIENDNTLSIHDEYSILNRTTVKGCRGRKLPPYLIVFKTNPFKSLKPISFFFFFCCCLVQMCLLCKGDLIYPTKKYHSYFDLHFRGDPCLQGHLKFSTDLHQIMIDRSRATCILLMISTLSVCNERELTHKYLVEDNLTSATFVMCFRSIYLLCSWNRSK